jgi:SOS regulatory protein LexA
MLAQTETKGQVDPNTQRRRSIQQISSFIENFGQAHLILACHAAFPLALTPDMLYQIWAYFTPQTPWIAVADILLSNLCHEVGNELYEMDIATRILLLTELKEDPRFGQQRIDQLADFLTAYIAQQLSASDPEIRELAYHQQWTSLIFAKPTEAVYELAQVLSDLVVEYERTALGDKHSSILRLTSFIEIHTELLSEFTPLLIYSRSIKKWASGNIEEARQGVLTAKNQNIALPKGINGLPVYIPSVIGENFAGEISPRKPQTSFTTTLSARQKKILNFIIAFIQEKEYSPHIREIGEAVGISSTSVVNYNLAKLENEELIFRERDVSRSLSLNWPKLEELGFSTNKESSEKASLQHSIIKVPVLGKISTGMLIRVEAVDPAKAEEVIEISKSFVPNVNESQLFGLQVSGDGMLNACLMDGDIVILNHQERVHDGEIIAAWIEGDEETILCYLFQEGTNTRLQPANPNYRPIILPNERVRINGKVVLVVRLFKS